LTRYSFKTTKQVKGLIDLAALRLHCDASDLIHELFLNLALTNIDEMPDSEIKSLFNEASAL